MAKERPEGLVERLVYSVEMIETHLGILARIYSGASANESPAEPPNKTGRNTAKAGTGSAKTTAKAAKGGAGKEDTTAPPTAADDLSLDDVSTDTAVPPPMPSVQDCRDALNTYLNAQGKPAAIELLREFKAQNVSTLPEGDRQGFIDRALGNS